jgi:prepilin-type N-terminal cleavage/methylation domain-containing protein
MRNLREPSSARFSEQGFSLIEVMIALGVLTTGVLATAAVMAAGVQKLASSPGDVIVTQKAAQAVEAVFAARDSHKLTWDQIRNVNGGTGSDGGVFVDGLLPLALSGSDGLVNTSDDLTVETMTFPGLDGNLNTADDQQVPLSGYQREIKIRDVAGTGGRLRSIEVTVTYQSGTHVRKYTLTTFISAYA